MPTDFKVQDLAQLDRDRFSAYKAALDFYNGAQWERTSKNRQLVFNYSRISVDKITSYLMNELNFSFEALPGGKPDLAKQAEDLIYLVHDQNNAQELDYTTEIDTAILGDGCYKVTWDAVNKRVRITAPDVNGIYAWWTGDDLNQTYKVASRYQLSAGEILTLYKKSTTKKSAFITELWTDKDFTLYLENDVIDKKPNPYGFIPFIIFPNLRRPKQFWGVSDIPQLIEPQRELNRALSQLSRILEVSGNPIAVLEGVEASEDIQVRPGAVWNLPADTKAYLLDLLQGGGIRLHIDYIDLVYRTMHDISESPRAAYGGIQHELSGVALEVELQSLLQKVKRKRLIRTNVYKRRNVMILKLWAKFMRQDFTHVSHRVCWGQVLPQDKARDAQNEQLCVQSGVHSRRTAMDNLGVRDPELEFTKWLDERRRILEMNNEFKAPSTQGGARERKVAPEMEPVL
ncbi:MAG: phage portal protein [Dehalococcoidia bacterium]